jgi:hypothetical protein
MLNKDLTTSRQLPVWAAFAHAMSSVRHNLTMAFRVSWPWYALIALISLTMQYVTGGNASADRPDVGTALVMAALILVSSASIAVNWHRYILLDDVPPASMLLRLDPLMWRYLGNLLLIGLLVFLVMIPFSLVAALLNAGNAGFAFVFFVALPIAGFLFFRLGVKLPSIALGRTDFSFNDAWAVTKGNGWEIVQLFFLNIAAALLVSLVIYGIERAVGFANAELGEIVSFILQFLANWFFTIFGITILTSLYGFFVQHRDF